MMANKFYLTTPLYYVNASPHIGHSYTNIAADCLARYRRGQGFDVYFLTGTDEHGQKVQRAALDQKLSPQEFSDRMVLRFKNLWKDLDITYDDFIRTTETRHTKTVQRVLEILHKKGDIYKDRYAGWYCTPCETFWTELQITQQVCPDCKRQLERIEEENFFFSLSKYQDWLIAYIKGHPDFIKPASRYNEVLSFITSQRLNDLCISRPKTRLSWGIEFPFNPEYVVYVWFDALVNYISAVGFSYDEKKFKRYWPADLHLIGKDILRQHAIYWPIMLHALEIEPPEMIFAHGWWMLGESKMSKSKGNIVDPQDLAKRFGVDAYRYFLLRDVPFGLDGNFSEDALIKRLNSDLANDLGNLIHRTTTMLEKYSGSISPDALRPLKDSPLVSKADSLIHDIERAFKHIDFSLALDNTWSLINSANRYIEQTKPWGMFKAEKNKELKEFLANLIYAILKVQEAVLPFMPQTAASIKEQFGKEKIKKGKPLFPRIV